MQSGLLKVIIYNQVSLYAGKKKGILTILK